jgi:glycosyltransferase involved in cell wall biosynthesis
MESLAVGLPVCLSDISPHKEILQHDPIAGELFKLNSINSISITLKEIVANNYSIQSEAARSIIRNSLNSKYMSKNYQHLYSNISNI